MPVKEPSFVMIEGRRMAYDEVSPPHPKGTVLLLTGGGNRLDWYKQLEVFGRTFRTIALDHRDTGDSDPVSEAYTLADLADDGASVLSALGVQRAHVVGISMGGYVALHVALRHPERVEKLVLVAATAGGSTQIPPSPELWDQLMQLLRNVQLEAGEKRQLGLSMTTAPGYFESHPEDWDKAGEHGRYHPLSREALIRQGQATMTHDVSGQLDRIQAPTLVVHGELDPLVVPENGHYLAEHIKGAKLLLYPNTGHLVIIERAEEFNRDVLAFLEE
jgi:pimeloyl-ACP methyl ester carboxylesterase